MKKFGLGLLAAVFLVCAMAAAPFFTEIEIPSGTAGAPSLMFRDDPDTGVYRAGANEFAISAGGVQRMKVDDTGIEVEVTGDLDATGVVSAGTSQPDLLQLTADTELTIATGSVTATQTAHTIDSEADAASDDLDTIAGGVEGDLLFIQAANAARTVVVKNGTGNIVLDADVSLDDATDALALYYDGTQWVQVGSSLNGSMGETNTASNVGTDGLGVFKQKTGVDLEFKNVAPGSTKISVSATGDDIDIDAVEANFTLDNIGGTLGVAKGGARQEVQAIGDAAASSFTVTHSFQVDVQVQVYRTTGGQTVYPDIDRTNATTVTIDFGTYVPSASEFTVLIQEAGVES